MGTTESYFACKRRTIIVESAGDDTFIPIPDDVLLELGLKKGDTVDVSVVDGTLIVKPIKKLKGEAYIEEYYGKPATQIKSIETEIVDWGKPKGDEEW